MLSDHVSVADAAIRLALTIAAGGAIGFDRNRGGHPAGLGTTILVCLAACMAMMEANLLLPTAGKTPASFATLDFMRLPLGILTGMGFLGAGAILRRGDHISGLTTAATLWVTTVIGLCLGGGQIALGVVGTLLCVAVGVAAKRIERLMAEDRTASLVIEASTGDDCMAMLERRLEEQGVRIVGLATTLRKDGCEYRMRLRWRSRDEPKRAPEFIEELARRESIRRVSWIPSGAPPGSGGED